MKRSKPYIDGLWDPEITTAAEERRLRMMWVTPELVAKFGRGAYRVTANELPVNAVVVGAHYDEQRRYFVIVLACPEWESVPFGDDLPIHPVPQIERKFDDD